MKKLQIILMMSFMIGTVSAMNLNRASSYPKDKASEAQSWYKTEYDNAYNPDIVIDQLKLLQYKQYKNTNLHRCLKSNKSAELLLHTKAFLELEAKDFELEDNASTQSSICPDAFLQYLPQGENNTVVYVKKQLVGNKFIDGSGLRNKWEQIAKSQNSDTRMVALWENYERDSIKVEEINDARVKLLNNRSSRKGTWFDYFVGVGVIRKLYNWQNGMTGKLDKFSKEEKSKNDSMKKRIEATEKDENRELKNSIDFVVSLSYQNFAFEKSSNKYTNSIDNLFPLDSLNASFVDKEQLWISRLIYGKASTWKESKLQYVDKISKK